MLYKNKFEAIEEYLRRILIAVMVIALFLMLIFLWKERGGRIW